MDDAKGRIDDGNDKSVSSMSSIEEKEKRMEKRKRKMRQQHNVVRYI